MLRRTLGTLTALALIAVAALLVGVPTASSQEDADPAASTVPVIELDGTIDPATADWIDSALDDAADDDAPFAIIHLDTPGGLDDSMREMVKDITGAPMPVVVYVSPEGARAGSAGVFITEAADVAAMAPQTNIGSASPIQGDGSDIGGTLEEKITNDAVAYVRALASQNGRNPELAEQMVTDAVNVTAQEALDADLIDLIAASDEELLSELEGFRISGPKGGVISTDGVSLEERDMPLQYEILQLLVNPNIAFLLILLGFVGLTVEAFAPGAIIPGAIGAASLLLGAFGSAQLPVEGLGVLLLVLAVILVIAETQLPTGGLVGLLGVGALVAGGLLLFDTDSDAYEVSVPLVIVVGAIAGGGAIFVGRRVLAARHEPIRSGFEHLVGEGGVARDALDPIGQVYLDGALWRARAAEGEGTIEAGYRVTVEAVEGLTLSVRSAGKTTAEDTSSDAGERDSEKGAV